MSIPRRSQELEMIYGTLWRILHLDTHLRLYKVQLKQQLKPADHLRRRYVGVSTAGGGRQFFEQHFLQR